MRLRGRRAGADAHGSSGCAGSPRVPPVPLGGCAGSCGCWGSYPVRDFASKFLNHQHNQLTALHFFPDLAGPQHGLGRRGTRCVTWWQRRTQVSGETSPLCEPGNAGSRSASRGTGVTARAARRESLGGRWSGPGCWPRLARQHRAGVTPSTCRSLVRHSRPSLRSVAVSLLLLTYPQTHTTQNTPHDSAPVHPLPPGQRGHE